MPTVLVVDDDPMVRRTFERVLTARRCAVETYATAEEAVARVVRGGIDVVVSDVSMPRLSGIDLLREVRSRDPEIPVVLVTGSPTPETAAEAAKLGAFEYLVKPVRPMDLWAAVGRAVGRPIEHAQR